MKTKLLLLLTICLMSFGMNAQVNSVALVGEAVGGWPPFPGDDPNQLTRVDADNWIIENVPVAVGKCKLRANNTWGGAGGEWAGAFPTAVGTSSGDINVTIAGVYTVTLNTATGVYNFDSGTAIPVVKLVGTAVTEAGGLTMAPTSATTFQLTNVTLVDGTAQFDVDGALYGDDTAVTSPEGNITGGIVDSALTPVQARTYSSITLDTDSGLFVFTAAPVFPSIALVGAGAGGWPTGAPGEIDANALTTTDGVIYTLNGLTLTTGDVKFRQDNAWAVNWGGTAFPAGTAVFNSPDNIPAVAGTYDVTFNRTTLEYSFTVPTIAIVGSGAGGWPTGAAGEIDVNQMTTTDGVNYTISGLTLTDGEIKFRQNNAWGVNWGGTSFPAGTAVFNSPDNIPSVAGIYDITFNKSTLAYSAQLLSTKGFLSSNFKIHPNPTQNVWNFTSAKQAILSIQIVDVLGKTVMTIAPKDMTATVDASSLNSGLYFAKITTA
ncbi:T9SS type A sorting domain-containing protein, partial [Flavobacterium sp.]|uniref:T9SS type A sorting domain-containing protein n=1 Tax=Flavobacterium sp. TaxID=239 RepID=UPI002631A326